MNAIERIRAICPLNLNDLPAVGNAIIELADRLQALEYNMSAMLPTQRAVDPMCRCREGEAAMATPRRPQ